MKKTKFLPGLTGTGIAILLFAGIAALSSCEKKKVDSITIHITDSSGHTDTCVLNPNGRIFVDAGDQQYVVKPAELTEENISLQFTPMSYSYDTATKQFSISKKEATTEKLGMNKPHGLSGGLNLTVTTMAMVGLGEVGDHWCDQYGGCCVRSCYTVTCCTDQDNCKNTDCQACADVVIVGCNPPTTPGGVTNDPHPTFGDFMKLFKADVNSIAVAAPAQ